MRSPQLYPPTEDSFQELRTWLDKRYEHQITKLNAAWNSQHRSFGEVPPPRTLDKPSGRDWYRFRDLKTRQFIDSCAAALAGIPRVKVPYRLLLDYGNVGDPMAWKRGSLSFGFTRLVSSTTMRMITTRLTLARYWAAPCVS